MNTNRRYFLYSTLSNELKHFYYEGILRFTSKLIFEYPEYLFWYNSLFMPKYTLRPEREIVICEVGYQIAGIAILKRDAQEKKICTFRVAKNYQRQGIGKEMMEIAFEWLDTDSPIITMHRNKLEQFSKLLDYYNFSLEQSQKHYYSIFSTELVYNGVLPNKDFIFPPIQIGDMQALWEKIIVMKKRNFNKYVNIYNEILNAAAGRQNVFYMWDSWCGQNNLCPTIK